MSLTPLFPGETSDLEEANIDGGDYGRRSPRWRRYGGLLDRMMATSASSFPWGHHLWRFIGWTDVWTAWWLGIGLRVFLAWRPRWSGMSSTIYNDEARQQGAAEPRRPACDDGCAQGGGTVWRRGGIDGRDDKVYCRYLP
jgi:hypothetical protein